MLDQLAQLIVNGLILGTWLGCIAVGFSLAYAVREHFHVAHHAVWVLGGFVLLLLVGQQPGPTRILLSLAVTALVLSAAAAGIAKFLYAPLQSSRNVDIFVASLALLTVIQNTLAITFGPKTVFLDLGAPFLAVPVVRIGPVYIEAFQIVFVCIAIPSLAALALWLQYSNQGRLVRAVISNRELSTIVGIDVQRVVAFTYAAGGAILAPAVIPLLSQAGLGPYGGLQEFVLAIAAAFTAAPQRIAFVMLGALLLALVRECSLLWVSGEWQTTVALSLFVIVLTVSRSYRRE